MADNVSITPGTGDTVAADQVTDGILGTCKVQYVKLMDGTIDGTTKATVNANGLKVDGSAVTQPISAVSLPLPNNAAQETGGHLATIDSSTTEIALDTDKLDVNLSTRLADVTFTGRINTQGQKTMAASTPIVIASDQSTLPVSAASLPLPAGAATSANQTNGSQATQIVQGGNTAIVDAAGDVQVDVNNFPATQIVSQATGTNLHTVVDSGTITANAGTNLNTSALALDATLTGGNQQTKLVQGGNTAVVDAAGDLQVDVNNFPATQVVSQATGTNLHTVLDSGTLTSITNALPAGTNVIGHIIADAGSTTAVTGNVTVVQPTGTNLHAVIDSGTITLSGTSPVSGTVTANQGTPNSLANGWPVELSDGTNLLGVTAHPVRTDPTGTTTQPISGTVTANIGTSGSLALDTSVTGLQVSQGSTTSGEKGSLVQGAVTTAAPAYTTAQTSPLSLTVAGALRTDASATTQPVSGTVTANAGTNLNTSALALDATLTGGTQQTKIVQGGNTAVVDATGDLQVDVNNFPATTAVTQSTSPWVENVSQFGGSNVVTGTGASGAGIPRVTLSNDSSLAANQSVNNSQISGTAVSVNNGTTDAGTQRVTLSSDSTGQVKLATGANTIGALTANQSINVAQVNGSTTVTAATGVQKVGIVGNTGAAVDAAGQNAAAPANEILVAGQFNTTPTTITTGNVSPLQLNSQGALIVEDTTSTKAIFSACATATTPAATTTDFMTIYGSGTKTIKVLKIEIAYTATALADLKIFIVKRSATNTGGTSSAPTIVPFDSNNTATGTVLVYTANPTALGAAVGTASAADILVGGTTTVTASQLMYTFDFTGGTFGSGVVLRGTAQGLAINMNGAAVPTGGSVNTCNITWIEE